MSSSFPEPDAHESDAPESEMRALDELFAQAGLVRNRHGKDAGATHLMRRQRMERVEPEDLRRMAGEVRVAPNGVHWLPAPGLAKTEWLWHGFSTRKGGESRAYCPVDAAGELNLGFTAADERETVVRNRRLLAEAITGDGATPLITARQFHSGLIAAVQESDAARTLPPKADALITDQPGLLLGIQTADCIPVLVADRKRRVVAAFHAGWRGTVKRIVQMGIGRMRLEYGCRPEDLCAAIGPGIGACCYAVGEEVLSEFESQFAYARELFREVHDSDAIHAKYPMLFLTQRAPGHSPLGPGMHLDLVEANRRQLLDAGVREDAIDRVGGCTNCQTELFFSHRAGQGHAGRMLSVIGIRPEQAR
jgi:YfiH family protein